MLYSFRKLESDLGIQITQVDAQTLKIFAPSKSLLDEAKESIENMVEKAADQAKDLEFGAIYNCQVDFCSVFVARGLWVLNSLM